MLELNFEIFPILETERLKLRAITEEDAPEIFFLRSDASVLKYLDRHPETGIDQTKIFINLIGENAKNAEGIFWGITLKKSNTVIGTICYWNIQKQHYRSEIGYALHPSYRGKGIMHEAMNAVLHYGFEKMKLHSVEANVNPSNEASMKLLEKNGFVREAYFRENYFFDGSFLDSAVYSLLASKK